MIKNTVYPTREPWANVRCAPNSVTKKAQKAQKDKYIKPATVPETPCSIQSAAIYDFELFVPFCG